MPFDEVMKENELRRRLIDFLVVVAGVLVAIQLMNWIEERKAARETAALTKRLQAELAEEAWISAYTLAYNGQVLENAEQAIAALSGGAFDDEEFLIAAYRASQYTWWNRRRSAFDELLALGRVGAAGDADLRAKASLIYNSSLLEDVADSGAQSRYRETFRMTVPVNVQQALGETCGDRAVEIGDYAALSAILDYDCDLRLSPPVISEAVESLRASDTLAPSLRLRIATLRTQLADLEEYNDAIKSFGTSIDED